MSSVIGSTISARCWGAQAPPYVNWRAGQAQVQGLPEQAAESTARVESRQVARGVPRAARGGELARLLSSAPPDVVMCAD